MYKEMSTSGAATNMNNLYAHLRTLMPQRRAKRGREHDVTEERVTKPKTLGAAGGGKAGYRADGKTQTPAPSQTT
jgi:hypothetical protein